MTSVRVSVMFLIAAVQLSIPPLVNACIKSEPTRDTGPGPHDYSAGVTDSKLWRKGDLGEPMILRARVLDACGKPVAGARIQILHANQDGAHEPDRWRADLTTDERGVFKLLTVYPGYTGGIPRHMHFNITHHSHAQLYTRLFFKNDPNIEHGVDDLAIVLEEIQRSSGKGWVAGFEFVLAPN